MYQKQPMKALMKLCTLTIFLWHSTNLRAQSIVPLSWIAPPARDTIVQYPYCTSFEQDDSLWFAARTRGQGVGSFVRGNPEKTRISAARTGNAAWYIGPQGDYGNFDSSVLYLPAFEVQKDSTYLIQFHANWSMDFFPPSGAALSGDGFTMERHLEAIDSWGAFGRLDTVEPYAWYNAAVLALRNFTVPPNNFGFGWTAQSQGYELQQQLFKAPNDGILRLRFRFGSDDAFTGEGVAIDDFCFQKISAATVPTSVKPEMDKIAAKLFPNPSHGYSTLLLQLDRSEEVRLFVTNPLGQIVWQAQHFLEAGMHPFELQLTVTSSALYFVHWESKTQKDHVRWFVQP